VSPLLATKLDVSRVLGHVSFDCHPGSPFFSHQRRTLLLFVYVFSLRHHSLSLCRRSLLFRQQHTLSLSLSLLRRSLARSMRSDVPAGLSCSPPPAACILRITLNFFPQKASAAAGRLVACTMAKGASGRRPHRPLRCRRGRDAATDPPPRGRARLVVTHRHTGN
jgi:hypothetical protein